MKTVLFALALATAMTAQADEVFVCRDVKAGPDHGLSLTVSVAEKKGTLSQMTIMGPRPVQFGELNCEFPPAPDQVHPDQIVTLATCETPAIPDAGYSVIIRGGGFTGITTAKVSEISILGSTEISRMTCSLETDKQQEQTEQQESCE